MNQVTTNGPPLDHYSPTTLGNGTDMRHGLAIPMHSFPSSRNGYRMPPIEDCEAAGGQASEKSQDRPLDKSSHSPLPTSPNAVFRNHSASASVVSFGERLIEQVYWQERVRHYTWTFFTVTMATGGIANVLYTGTTELQLKTNTKP